MRALWEDRRRGARPCTDAPAWSSSGSRCSRYRASCSSTTPDRATAITLAVDHRHRRGRGGMAHHTASSTSRTTRASCSAASEARFRALVQHATDIVIVLNERGEVTYVSPAVDTVFGRPADELLGSSFVDYLDAARHRPEPGALRRRSSTHPDQPVPTEFDVLDGDDWRWIEATWTNQLARARGPGHRRQPPRHHRPQAGQRVRTRRDPRARADPLGRARPRDADHPRRRARGVHPRRRRVDPAPRSGDAARSSPSRRRACPPSTSRRCPAHTTVDRRRGVPERHRDPTCCATSSTRARGPDLNALCLAHGLRGMWSAPIRSPDGSDFLGLFAFFVRTVRDPRPSELAILERARDLAALAIDRDARTQELGRLALHDTLTGLPNRALAQDRLEHALERLAQTDDDTHVAVLFVDLDRFKLVNDGLGHDTGDELLVAVSRRLGGDRPPPGHHRPHRRRRVRRALRGPARRGPGGRAGRPRRAGVRRAVRAVTGRGHGVGQHRHRGHRSVVRSSRRTSCRTPTRPCTAPSDAAAHATSCSTRRCTRRRSPACSPSVRSGARSTTTSCACSFQPEFDLATGERVAVEALLRWEHPVRGLVAPGDFLRVAEETGIIVPMGAWVLAQACEVARAYGARPGDGAALTVSINVSARQLQRPDFPELVARTARDARRRPVDAVPRGRRERAARRPRHDGRGAPGARRTSACSSRSTTSAPVDRRSPTSAASRSTSSRSTACSSRGSAAARPTTRSSPPPSTWPTRSTWS